MQWLKHAFALGPPEAEPTERQRQIVDGVCDAIVRRRMAMPARMFLETCRPLNFMGAQALHFFGPFISALTDADGHRQFAAFLEQRGSIDYICRRLEQLEADRAVAADEPHRDDDDSGAEPGSAITQPDVFLVSNERPSGADHPNSQ